MNRQNLKRVGFVVVVCALAGALAGIAGSMAAPSKKSSSGSSASSAKRQLWHARMHARRFGRLGGFGPGPAGGGGPAVHAQAVVPNAAGDGFDTITFDAGTLKSIDGSKLTVTEGTDKATYGTPTIDVGSSAKVFRSHQKASLGDLKEGDLVRIIQAPKGTLVWAEDPAFEKQERQNGPRFGPPGFGPGGPPPGAYPGGSNGSNGSSGSSGSNS